MATITKPFTFSAGAIIVASEHNSNFDTIYSEFNGSISNANISGSAAIVESKLLFSGTGHGHTGSTDGKQISGAAIAIASEAQGDILIRGASNWGRLGAGTAGQALTTGGAAANPAWAGMTTRGDVEYMGASTRSRLAAGTAGQVLTTGGAGADPSWTTIAAKCILEITSTILLSTTIYRFGSVTDATEDNVSGVIPFACTAKNLNVRITDTDAATMVTTVYRNGSATGITTTHGAGVSGTQTDSTHTQAFSAGDRISVLTVNNRATTFNGRITLELDPT